MGTIRDYLALVRFPNLFTIPSNVMVGFSQLLLFPEARMENLILLTITSILLYVVGIIINDYRDLEVDRNERPERPLPSGKISQRSALGFAFLATILAIILAAFVSVSSVLLAVILLITIVAYDCWLKNNILGHFTIALARVFNVVLGSSPGIIILISIHDDLSRITVILVSVFLYVTAISYMSRIEVEPSPKKSNFQIAVILLSMIPAILTFFTLMGFFKWDLFLSLVIFVGMLIKSLVRKYGSANPEVIKKIVRNLVLSIIVLDSVFMSGTVGFAYGLSLLVLLVPAMILSRRFYVT
ncbi:MAG: UbiA family prenyltransferase [Thermoproteota archaeon]|nr:UbiA family prenyltransferase [Thermoproteota archaeon]